VTREVGEAYEAYDLARVAQTLRQFTWSEFADWHVEWAKGPLRGSAEERADQAAILSHVLERILRLLHPVMPFVTEELWRALTGGESVVLADWPEAGDRKDSEAEYIMSFIQSIVVALRRFRAEHPQIASDARPTASVVLHVPDWLDNAGGPPSDRELAQAAALSRWGEIRMARTGASQEAEAKIAIEGASIHVPLAGLLDVGAERARLTREIEKARAEVARIEAKLADPNFAHRAKEEVVEAQRERLVDARTSLRRLSQALRELE
jgi:valyl-tRNA synthetase